MIRYTYKIRRIKNVNVQSELEKFLIDVEEGRNSKFALKTYCVIYLDWNAERNEIKVTNLCKLGGKSTKIIFDWLKTIQSRVPAGYYAETQMW